MKNSNDTVGNRTRDLSTFSAVPQPTTPPRTPKGNIRIHLKEIMYEAELHIPRSPGRQLATNIFAVIAAVPVSLPTKTCISLHAPGRQRYINVRFIGDSQTCFTSPCWRLAFSTKDFRKSCGPLVQSMYITHVTRNRDQYLLLLKW